jgi:hypothetical protein
MRVSAIAKGRGLNMFGRTKKGPAKTFSHAEGCKIQANDPTVSIEWSEVESRSLALERHRTTILWPRGRGSSSLPSRTCSDAGICSCLCG